MSPLPDDLLLSDEKLALLEELLGAQGIVGPEEGGEPLRPRADRGACRLSFAQERLWFLDQLATAAGRASYNIPSAVRLDGPLDAAALAASLTAVAARHETLRTRIAAHAGAPVAVVDPPAAVPLPRVDLAALPAAGRRREAAALAGAEARRPFDLARELPWRALLVLLGPGEHQILLTLHHIAADGWSVGILLAELRAFYVAGQGGPRPTLPRLPVQYLDFADWQRRQLAGPAAEALFAWWEERLAGLPESLALPTDRPRPRHPSPAGLRRAAPLPPELGRRLAALARRRRMPLHSLLLAAFAVLLAAWSGDDDLAVGTPVANRERPEVEGLIGFFVNTLVVRLDLAGDPAFSALLERVREAVLEAQAHQDLPFDQLVARLAPDRREGSPLFRVMFGLQESPRLAGWLPGLAAAPLEVETGTAKLDLLFLIVETPETLTASVELAADLFDAPTGERLLAHFAALLAAVAEAPERPLSRLSLLTPGERQQLLVEWNDTAFDLPAGATVHGLFAARAAQAPATVAAVAGDGHLTYGALAARAACLAGRLARAGAAPDRPVGLLCDRGLELPASLLAILAAGGAYLPLDPAWPDERLADLLARAGAPFVLVDRAGAARLAGSGVPFVRLDDPEDAAGPAGPAAVDSDHLAYVLFTSGSTGSPKAVGVPHRAVVRLILGSGHAELTEAHTWLQLAPLAFDASTLEVWGPLLSGGRLVLMPPGPAALADIGRAIERHQVTAAWLTAGLFHQMVDAELPRLKSLCQLLAGGDVVSPGHARRALAALPGLRLIDGYGPTEATTFTCCHALGAADPVTEPIPIGRPIGRTTALLFDRAGRTPPIGVAGELWAGGVGLARGYLGDPAATAVRFVPDPREAGGRLYRTGDLARHRADGTLEFLGRRDRQVKVRGFRVEPGEIEAALARHPRVRQAAVVARTGEAEDRRLVAFVVEDEKDLRDCKDLKDGVGGEGTGGGSLGDDLRRFLGERLPPHLVPAAFVVLPALPLTANGKLDLRALPEDQAAASPVGEAPRTPLEEIVAAVWAEVLGRETVGRGDDFFALGGHSLLATRAIARLRQSLGEEIPLAALFEAPTVAAFAAWVAAERRGGVEAAPIGRAARDLPLPLSFAQRRLWFLDQLRPGDPAYNIPVAFRLAGAFAPARLAAAFTAVVARHEVLSTRFAVDPGAPGGEPRQAIAAPGPAALPLADLGGLPAGRRAGEAARLRRAAAGQPFDLARGPLLRLLALRLGMAEHEIVVVLHHIAADGWSMSVLAREVGALYADAAAPLPALPIQYADYAVWQRDRLTGGGLAAAQAFWTGHLAGAPERLPLPVDRRQGVDAGRGATLAFALPWAAGPLCRSAGVTPFMALLTAWAALLARLAGEDDLVIGTPVANRDRLELEGLIGFFVNLLALRLDLSGDPPYRELLDRVRGTALAAYTWQEMPFERVVEAVAAGRDLARSPLVQATFSLQNAPPAALALPGLAVDPLPLPVEAAKFDLSLTVAEEDGGGLAGWLEYDTDLFDAATVARLTGHLSTLLAGAVAEPLARLSELPLLSPAERHQVGWEWNDTRPGPADRGLEPVERAVARQAAEAPHRVALVHGERSFTYGELAHRAGALAARLGRLGVGAESLVGLLAGPSFEFVAGCLGVLDAGAAYLPLDPELPAERLGALVAESGAALVLAERDLAGRLPAGLPGLDLAAALAPDDAAGTLAGAADADLALAYVLYTSGSTGRPKGVEIPRRALASYIGPAGAACGIAAGDRVLQFASPGSDISVEEIYTCLTRGATLVLRDDEMLHPETLVAECARRQLTVLDLPTAYWHELASWLERTAAPFPPPVRLVILGGEAALPAHREAWWRRVGGRVRLDNTYGPTEATVVAARETFAGPVDAAAGLAGVAIGRPVEGAAVHVAGPDGGLLPAGAAGELAIAGPGVGRGYRGQPAATATAFVPDPFAGEPGARLYRTGDRARRLPDGRLEVLGRLDGQVKIRGLRIEPGEIEAALVTQGEVAEAAVVAAGDGADRRLIAYWTARHPPGPAAATLSAHLRARLPAAMVPSAFVELAALPRTATGKVDRRALPAPAAGGHCQQGAAPVRPRTPAEELLVGLWTEVLGAALPAGTAVGVDDDFFALGGHSLLATQLLSRVRQAFALDLPLRQLFETPTPAGLAATLAGRAAGGQQPAPPVVPVPRDGSELPLSFAQQRIWLIDHLAGGESPFYNQPAALEIDGELAPAALAAAFGEVVRRHEVLRTAFPRRDGRPVQEVLPPRAALPLLDLGGLPAAASETEARRLALAEARRPFALAAETPLRLHLLRLTARRHLLLFTLHHIAGDGWALGVMMREVAALYAAARQGRPSPLPPLAVQYADYAVWQRRWLAGPVLEEQLAYWRPLLAGGRPALRLPTDRQRAGTASHQGGRLALSLPVELAGAAGFLARREGATLYMVLLAAFAALLGRTTGQDDLVVGSAVAGRTRVEIEPLVGCFVNLLPLRLSLAGNPGFGELLGRVRELALGAFAHQELPFELLAAELGWERGPGEAAGAAGAAGVQVAFGVENTPESPLTLPGLALRPLDLDPGMARFDLTLWIHGAAPAGDGDGGDGGLLALWTYDADLFDRETVERWHRRFVALLSGALADPGERIAALPLADAAERKRQAADWQEARAARFAAQRRRPAGAFGQGGER